MTAGTLKVELLLSAVWTDITTYVRIENSAAITRGRQDESSKPTAAKVKLALDNSDGRFSPRNPSGAYYGAIGRNTQLRVSVLDDHAVYQIRFWGEVSEWPVYWDLSGKDVIVSVTASGIRRRLTAGAVPLQSPYRRAEGALGGVLNYWPMEDGDDSTAFASAQTGRAPMAVSGTMDYAADSTFAASGPLPVYTGIAGTTGIVGAYVPDASGQQVRMLFKANSADASAAVQIIVNTSGAHYFVIQFIPQSGNFSWTMFNNSTGITEAGPTAIGMTEPRLGGRLSIELKQNGTGININVGFLIPGATSGLYFGVTTIPSATLGLLTTVQIVNTNANVNTTIGHLTVENHITSIFDLAAVLDAYAGETTADRAVRLCSEEGISLLAETADNLELMGPQTEATFLTLFDETAYVDGGISTEQVDDFLLNWRARGALYSQNVQLALAYTDLFDLSPTDDDQALQNDVTVTRHGGSSARAVLETGRLSVLPPPDGVGTYAQGYDLSLFTDDQAQYQAGWRMGLGTVDAPRWPVVSFDARKLTLAQRDALISMREGDLVTVSGLPSFTGTPGLNRVLVMGWSETVTKTAWIFTLQTVPAAPYDVIFLDDAVRARLDAQGSTTNATMTTTATSVSIASTDSTGTLWTTTATRPGDFPFDVTVAGEQMTVTAIVGASSPQTFTVTRSVNGVVKTHAIGETVSLTQPYRLAL